MYPKITVDMKKLKDNILRINHLCHDSGVNTMLVTKLISGYLPIVQALDGMGFEYLADSRIENLKKLQSLTTPKLLLRIPMISQADQVVRWAHASLNSEIATLRALDRSARNQNRIHGVILMVDLGDLREGYFEEEQLWHAVQEVRWMKNLDLLGIGTNLSCFGAIRPTVENLSRLAEIGRKLQNQGVDRPIISGGSTNAIYLVEQAKLPTGINNLRMGEGFFLGTEPSFAGTISGTHPNVFTLRAEIVEIKDKPSLPIGEVGFAAFRTKPVFEDRGIRTRAIVAVGKQDIEPTALTPKDPSIEILGASSDHMILDITQRTSKYEVGDIVDFDMGYAAILKAFTGNFVAKELIPSNEK